MNCGFFNSVVSLPVQSNRVFKCNPIPGFIRNPQKLTVPVPKQSTVKQSQRQCRIVCQSSSSYVEFYDSNYKAQNLVEQQQQSSWIHTVWQFVLKTLVASAFIAFAIFGSANSALAARSGGRVGGGSFSSFKAPSYSSSSSSSFSPSYSGGHSTTIIAPTVGLGMPSFFFPVFPSYGFGYGAPVSSGFVNLIILAFIAFFLVQVVSSFTSQSEDEVESVGGPASVVKVQVGLLGSARSLQQDLENMARQADTTSPRGLHFILQEIVLSLMRNPSYWVYATSGLRKVKNVDDAENAFNNMQMEERGKFEKETVVNVSGIKKDTSSHGGRSSSNELIVVTVIVAADGKLEIPQVRSAEDLRQALTILGGVRQEQLMATEILWTPSDENDFYSKDELFMDYPTLVPL